MKRRWRERLLCEGGGSGGVGRGGSKYDGFMRSADASNAK